MSGFNPFGGDGMGASYGGGMLLPPIAQLASTDPRRLLVQSLIASGHQAQARPMYSKFSALANALTSAAGPFEAMQLNKEYQGLNTDYLNQQRQAYGVDQATSPPSGPVPIVASAVPPEASAALTPPPVQTAPLPPMAPPQASPGQLQTQGAPAGIRPTDAALAGTDATSGTPTALFSNLERKYGLPGGALGRLMKTESGGVPRSGPPLPGGAAQGYFQFTPETASRYGVTPGDLSSEATGAAQYLADLTKRNGGNFSKALVDYGGFQTKDPTGYVGSVTGGAQPGSQLAQALVPPQQPSAQPASTVPASGAPDPLAAQIALARQAMRSNNPAVFYQGQQTLQALLQKQADSQIQLRAKLAEQGKMQDASGNLIPMGGAESTAQKLAYAQKIGEEGGAGAAKLGPTGEAAQITARTPAEAANAAALAGAKLPAEVLKGILTPGINRVTGGVSIPGIDPETMAKVRAVLGLPPAEGVGGSVPDLTPTGAGAPPPSTATAPPNTPVSYGTKSPADEVPSVKLPTGEMSLQKGEISPGRDPVAIKAGEDALEQAQHQYAETDERARGAATMHSQLANMRQQVTSGGVTPSALAPAKYFVSSAINAIAGPQAAQQLTGILPAAGDILTKEATQLGTQYARQTEGARQAVAGINIALKANPQLAQSKDGFLKILDILDAGTKHDLVAQEYGNAWFQKNQHYLGFQPWINQNHPPEEFISKTVPLDVPRLQGGPVDETKLQPNVTYQSPKGPAIWTGNGWRLTPQ